MALNDSFEGLELKGVTELNRDELGRGAYTDEFTWSSIAKQYVPLKKFTLFCSKELGKWKCSEQSDRS